MSYKILDIGSNTGTSGVEFFLHDINDYTITRTDINELAKPDVVWDITQPCPQELVEQFDVALCIHVIEHISFHKTFDALRNIIQPLKLYGALIIAFPSMEWAMQEVLHDRMDYRVQLQIFGMETDEYQYHKAGFTLQTMRFMINSLGNVLVKSSYQTPFHIKYDTLDFESMQDVLVCERIK